MTIYRGSNSPRFAHIRALYETIVLLIDALPDVPDHRRVALRDHLQALLKAHPELNDDIAVAQALAEEDGDAVSEDI